MGRGPKPAKGKAKPAVARKSPKNDAARVRDLEERLAEALRDKAEALKREAEALEQQTATGEILRTIAQAPTDVQPVFDAVAENAARLCGVDDVTIHRIADGRLRRVAHVGSVPVLADSRIPLLPGGVNERVLSERRTIHISDTHAPSFVCQFPGSQHAALGTRSLLATPLVREGVAIGLIQLRRAESRPFTDRQIALLETFADQAVIAIENVRLFQELQARNRDLTEALEQQTATSEILSVISSSPTDAQPVFEAVAESAVRLMGAVAASIYEFDGALIHLRTLTPTNWPHVEELRRQYPRPPDVDMAAGRVILERTILHLADLQTDPATPSMTRQVAERMGLKSVLWVPMLRDGAPVGVIGVVRAEAGHFSDKQVRLLQTFADQAVIGIENVRLFRELEARNRDLTTALDRQTATSDILRVISSSPTDVQPVFDAIAESSVRLCGALFGAVYRFDGGLVHLVAHHNYSPAALAYSVGLFPAPLDRRLFATQAIRERGVVHIRDVSSVAADYPSAGRIAHFGFRSVLVVPMLRGGEPIGAVQVWHADVAPFSEVHISLLQTFADQAVIAIENVRLFKELETRNRDLTEALEQQTATSEILRVISGSLTEVQPVFDAIVASAVRLCGARYGTLYRRYDDMVDCVAHFDVTPDTRDLLRRAFPRPVTVGTTPHFQRALLHGAVASIPDSEADADLTPRVLAVYRRHNTRSVVMVPLVRQTGVIGVLVVGHEAIAAFADSHVELLKTFADQAVIAIENVRLFNELQARNRDVTEALEQQTATAEVLNAISRAQTDAQPVFDIIAASALRLCGADYSQVQFYDGELIHLAAQQNVNPGGAEAIRRVYPLRVVEGTLGGRAIRTRAVVQIPDLLEDRAYEYKSTWEASGVRSLLAAPMLRDREPIGVIAVGRSAPGPFSDTQIALLQTFADQAVIAIENVRLFKELQARTQELTRSVGELRALGEVGQAISSTLDLQTVLSTIVARATQLSGTDAGVIYEYDEQREVFVPRATAHLEAEIVETMLAAPVRKGEGATGRLAELQAPIQLPDILEAPTENRVRDVLVRAGYRALLAVPLVREDHLIGGLTVIRKATGEFAPEVIDLLRTFATQSALAIQNARLFREIEEKSRQLEVASQHKSEFLANMSHELRTPLNAIIGFSEVLSERMFGELNEKQEEYSKDIHASGQHLLSLINDILDLSKIEAGRMELELTDFDLPTALDSALTLVRERAGRRNITLQTSVDAQLGEIRADERKIRQVVLNLLSNAIKFTPEGGRIEIGAVPRDGSVEVSVSDTGVGIAPEDQEAVFEEFRQVGTAEKKVEGTGLGLTLCRKFVELHGGRIWVASQVGVGSTFTFTIPVRRGE